MPYYFAATSVLVATITVFFGRRVLARIDDKPQDAAEDAAAALIGDAV